MSEPEKRTIYFGTVTLDDGEKTTIALDVPLDADAASIAAAITAAEAAKVAAQTRESKRLRELFLEDDRR
jgi:hypothetical protein